ncbi:hypothetical protein [Massilia oculi]|uniref:hypothetical protein n=1 Tax=Massilia oculi TaxID=945844 RepID=UPI001AAF36BD|nr:hypothetical protein [Massilia oculi]
MKYNKRARQMFAIMQLVAKVATSLEKRFHCLKEYVLQTDGIGYRNRWNRKPSIAIA